MSQQSDLAAPVTQSDHRLGPVDAPLIVVEYADLECPNCRQAMPAVKLLAQRFAGRLQIVFRHFPLEEVHPHAIHAALAAEAAAAQGKFWEMHDLLFENQLHLELDRLRGYARQLGLDLARFGADMVEGGRVQRIRDEMEGGRRSGVRGTPTFFVNGRRQDVSFGLHLLAQAVDEALQQLPKA